MSDEQQNAPEQSSDARAAVREKAQKVRTRITARKIARRVIIGVVIAAVVVAGGWAAWTQLQPDLNRPEVTPQNITDTDGIDVSAVAATESPAPADEDPIHVDVYVDYLSPDSGSLEEQITPAALELVNEGVITYTYHPVSLLTGQGNRTGYSTRAAGAVMCVVSEAPASFAAYNTALLTDQPTSDDGYTDEQLASLASDAGATGSAVSYCIENRDMTGWVVDATARAVGAKDLLGAEGLTFSGTTPMIVADGRVYDGAYDDPADFTQFLLTVQSEEHFGE
ncbi:DsbA family protein [Microbacterium indicum]|uniref:DsbA family protein n=1 Tax=Microbacterium indicum TaxID=358100 RepID=UPI00068819FE|nr:thioredoxin domain-containing protein [Microbacterium indicum]